MDTYFYEIWSYFGPFSRVFKPRLKRCSFVDFLGFSFESEFSYTFERYAWTPIFMIFGAILAPVEGW